MAGNRVKRRRKSGLSYVFKNNKFLLIVSFVIAVTVWITISLSDTHQASSTVSKIPIQINLSDNAISNGLEIFSGNDQTASVNVEGNRVALGSISSDDITVSAQTAGTIQTSGTWTLSLTAKKNNPSDNFEIISSVNPSVITVFVDQMRESEFEVENKIKYKVSEGYHASVALSTDKITVKGPQTLVDKISKVAIVGKVDGELKDDYSMEAAIKLFSKNGDEITSSMITLSDNTITANFSVLPEKEIPIKVSFTNKPNDFDIENYIETSIDKIFVAAPQEVLDKLTSISTEDVDFNTLKNKSTTLQLKLNMPEKTVNLSDTDTVKVKIDLRSFKSKNITIDKKNLSVSGLGSDYSYNVTTDNLMVVAIGPKSQLSKISSKNIICDIDASDIEGKTGSISLPVNISIVGVDSCWVYGEYSINLNVTSQ
ncbi:MAG: CdaR family protein [Ruminococcus sp.]|nr:CdaR family protein [Ruminococcus sp.]